MSSTGMLSLGFLGPPPSLVHVRLLLVSMTMVQLTQVQSLSNMIKLPLHAWHTHIYIYIEKLWSDDLDKGKLSSDDDLDTDKLSSDDLDTDKLSSDLDTEKLLSDDLDTGKLSSDDLDIEKLSSDDLDTGTRPSEDLDTDKLLSDLDTEKLLNDDLDTGKLSSNDLDIGTRPSDDPCSSSSRGALPDATERRYIIKAFRWNAFMGLSRVHVYLYGRHNCMTTSVLHSKHYCLFIF